MTARYRAGGFTLLEVMVALAVMAVAVTLLIELFSVNLRSIATSGSFTEAAIRADSKLRSILADPLPSEAHLQETVDDRYRLETQIREVQQSRTESLPVRMVEILLTVHWREGKREKIFKLETARMVEKTAVSRKVSP